MLGLYQLVMVGLSLLVMFALSRVLPWLRVWFMVTTLTMIALSQTTFGLQLDPLYAFLLLVLVQVLTAGEAWAHWENFMIKALTLLTFVLIVQTFEDSGRNIYLLITFVVVCVVLFLVPRRHPAVAQVDQPCRPVSPIAKYAEPEDDDEAKRQRSGARTKRGCSPHPYAKMLPNAARQRVPTSQPDDTNHVPRRRGHASRNRKHVSSDRTPVQDGEHDERGIHEQHPRKYVVRFKHERPPGNGEDRINEAPINDMQDIRRRDEDTQDGPIAEATQTNHRDCRRVESRSDEDRRAEGTQTNFGDCSRVESGRRAEGTKTNLGDCSRVESRSDEDRRAEGTKTSLGDCSRVESRSDEDRRAEGTKTSLGDCSRVESRTDEDRRAEGTQTSFGDCSRVESQSDEDRRAEGTQTSFGDCSRVESGRRAEGTQTSFGDCSRVESGRRAKGTKTSLGDCSRVESRSDEDRRAEGTQTSFGDCSSVESVSDEGRCAEGTQANLGDCLWSEEVISENAHERIEVSNGNPHSPADSVDVECVIDMLRKRWHENDAKQLRKNLKELYKTGEFPAISEPVDPPYRQMNPSSPEEQAENPPTIPAPDGMTILNVYNQSLRETTVEMQRALCNRFDQNQMLAEDPMQRHAQPAQCHGWSQQPTSSIGFSSQPISQQVPPAGFPMQNMGPYRQQQGQFDEFYTQNMGHYRPVQRPGEYSIPNPAPCREMKHQDTFTKSKGPSVPQYQQNLPMQQEVASGTTSTAVQTEERMKITALAPLNPARIRLMRKSTETVTLTRRTRQRTCSAGVARERQRRARTLSASAASAEFRRFSESSDEDCMATVNPRGTGRKPVSCRASGDNEGGGERRRRTRSAKQVTFLPEARVILVRNKGPEEAEAPTKSRKTKADASVSMNLAEAASARVETKRTRITKQKATASNVAESTASEREEAKRKRSTKQKPRGSSVAEAIVTSSSDGEEVKRKRKTKQAMPVLRNVPESTASEEEEEGQRNRRAREGAARAAAAEMRSRRNVPESTASEGEEEGQRNRRAREGAARAAAAEMRSRRNVPESTASEEEEEGQRNRRAREGAAAAEMRSRRNVPESTASEGEEEGQRNRRAREGAARAAAAELRPRRNVGKPDRLDW